MFDESSDVLLVQCVRRKCGDSGELLLECEEALGAGLKDLQRVRARINN